METRSYFQRIRTLEESLSSDHVVVVSLATADGGREGKPIELTRGLAAKMIVDQKARLATAEEAALHRAEIQGETAEALARSVSPQTAFLADISSASKDLGRGRKR